MILPFVREVLADVEKSLGFQQAATYLKQRRGEQTPPAGRIRLSGLVPTAKALIIPFLQRTAGRPLIVVTPTHQAAEMLFPLVQAFCELTGACDPAAVVHLPAYDVLPFENMSPHPEIQEERATALWKIAAGTASIVIAPMESTAMRLRSAEHYAGLARVVRRADSLDIEELVQHLNTVGYSAVDVVEMPGQYAVRGGLLDAYPPEADRPLRIELFGDEVESIRKFDPGTQRSAAPVDEIFLLPLAETPIREEVLTEVHARLSGSRLEGEGDTVREALAASGVTVFPGWEYYASAGAQHTLFDLLPDAVIFVDEPVDLEAEQERWWSKVAQRHEQSGVGNLATPEEIYLPPEEWNQRLSQLPGGELMHLGMFRAERKPPDVADIFEGELPSFTIADHAEAKTDHPITGSQACTEAGRSDRPITGSSDHAELLSQPTTRFHGSVPGMVDEVKKLTGEGRRVIFAAANTGEMERLADIFTEYQVPFRMGSRNPAPGSETYLDETAYFTGDLTTTTIVRAPVPDGVVLPESHLVLFGSRDLFDDSEIVVPRPLRQKSKTAAFMSDFRDLAMGDYVVHVEHGIGMYQGLKEIQQGDVTGEFMLLEFAEGAKLYVPLTRLDLIQKYRSSEGVKPPLSRLGGSAWAKTKARVKKAMKDMADELLKLYAVRKAAKGHSFPSDTQWQREFEDAFEYNETDDQLQATTEIKQDMESSLPMDRLLCGDVGYGKTEVAMRAAFKAVQDNKQAAVLAPTTVLVFQHFENFKRRFAAFPIMIEMMSRFRSPKQNKETAEKVEQGKIDILIGTHRILSRDIKFQDLGLVVVDEEQRFGVRHKERLKQLKKEVDVLTMSATPIPRTLHMSMVGLRDMSVIETPPKDRMAIQTVVAAFDEKLIKSALEYELERGGQAYFVHNRVETIYEIAAKIQALVPQARVLAGHGQMSEGELEKVMMAFVRHEADILVSTTIIENGLDIPLCNTIIINRADRHGLSELYQLRGRVGRSNRRAYAYLLVPAEQELTPIARRRLAALKEFSDLGAGFKIAALDLELRGAGNLLGGEQSGHVDAVGFEMYTSMLERTIRELKGEELTERVSTQLNLGIDIRIPTQYIAEENQRLRMYKRAAGVQNEDELADVRKELEDRYGPLPPPVRHLLSASSLKLLAETVGVFNIERKRDTATIKFTENAAVDPEKLARFVASNKGAQFTPGGLLKFNLKSTQPESVIGQLWVLLRELSPEPVSVG
ncbi:MAG TPA: transcription-repair coupling factor [Candidatus Angelobacter sp.]|nr:transcription-repair coupling factor [Candidatus Angelobacter sp.]